MRKIFILIVILILTIFLLNANEAKHNDNRLNNDSHFSFNVSQNVEFNDLMGLLSTNSNFSSLSKTLYADEGSAPVKEVSIEQKIKNATACGVTGTVFFALGLLMIIPGAVVMGVGYNNATKTVSTTSYNGSMSEYYGKTIYTTTYKQSNDWTEFAIGAGVFAFGMIFFLIGTPLMVAGWALRAYYKNQENKVSIYMESEKDRTSFVAAVSF